MGAVLSGWVHVMDGGVNRISHLLGRLAAYSTRNSLKVLAVWFTCVLLCFVGVLRFNSITDTDKLWVDPGGIGAKHQAITDGAFNSSSYYSVLFLVESKSQPGSGDVLTYESLSQLFAFKDALFALSTPTNAQNAMSMCSRRPDNPEECIVTGPLNMWDINSTLFHEAVTNDSDVKTTFASPVYPDGSKVDRELQLSSFSLTSSGASAVGISFQLLLAEPVTSQQRKDIREFISLTEKLVKDATGAFPGLKLEFTYEDAVGDALDSTVSKDIVLMIIAYILMVVFTQVMLGRPFSALEGRALLAFEAVLLVVFATLAGYGLCMAFGVPFTTLQEVLPFLLVGVGIDNSFVVLSALDRIDRKLPLEERTRKAMERVGMNITITSFVDIVALLFALVSKLPAVQYFGVYAAVSIISIYIAFISAFIALVAIDERRRERAKMDFVVCLDARPRPQVSYAESIKRDTAMDKVDHFLTRVYAPVLLRTPVRLLVLAGFGALTGYMIFSTTKLGTDFRVSDLCPSDSAVFGYITTHERLFHGLSFPANSVSLYIGEVDYSSAAVQQAIRSQVASTLDLESIRSDVSPSDWHASFTLWATSTAPFSSLPRDATSTYLVGPGFYQALSVFLSLPQVHFLYSDKLSFTSDGSAIALSRISFTTQYLSTAEQQVAALEEMRRAAESSPAALEGEVFYHNGDESYWEQKSLMREEATLLFSLTIAAVALVCALGLVHPISVLVMILILGMIFVDLLGALVILGIDLNSISVVNLVMAVGLVVDATAHIVRAFGIQQINLSRKEKVTRALGELGTPILLGAFTIILGVLPLVGASSEVFRVFFKCFMAIVILGWSHGLILLPVVLSFIGPTNIGVAATVATVSSEEASVKRMDVEAEN